MGIRGLCTLFPRSVTLARDSCRLVKWNFRSLIAAAFLCLAFLRIGGVLACVAMSSPICTQTSCTCQTPGWDPTRGGCDDPAYQVLMVPDINRVDST